jgi:RND family efflux transporter MFP subunit
MSVLSPKVSGEVVVISKDVGDWVSEGEVLLELDSDMISLKLRELQAQIFLSQVEQQRVQQLYEIQTKEFEDLKKAAKAHKGSVSVKELRTEESKTVQLRGEFEQIKNSLTVMRSQLEQEKLRLSYHQLKAPFSGQILERGVDVGQWINSTEMCFRLSNPEELEVELDVPDNLFFILSKGPASIEIHVSGQEPSFKLKNMRVRREVNAKSKTFVWLGEPEQPEQLVHGMSVEANVPSTETIQALTVNYSAILKNDAGAYIYKVVPGQSGDMVVPIPVKLGFKKGDFVVLHSPALKVGDRVVVEGGERLFPMTPVQAQGE